ncbi:hypothetical protein Tco_0734387 [Tanacetum coccineum]
MPRLCFAALPKQDFGGHMHERKTQKTLLKQMYKNFNAPSIESLDSIFNRLQKIVSQLAILGENISQEDLNLKFLRILPSEWNTHVVVWRNKPDLDSMSFDDLYNNFKIVEQEVKRTVTSSSNSGSQNMAFVTLLAVPMKLILLMFKESGMERSLSYEVILQDMSIPEETASKSMVAIDGASFDWSYMADEEVPTNLALMALSDLELDNLRVEFNKSEFNLATYKSGLASVEEQLIEKLKKEKESNQIKIDNFENASKSLDKLIGSQIFDNNRKGVGYNAVPPPPTGLFALPTVDLSNSGLEEFQQPEFKGYRFKANKGVCENSSNKIKKTTDAPIIEEWVSDCDEDDSEVIVLKFDNVQQKPKQANQPRKKKFCSNSSFNLVWANSLPISTARQSSSRAAARVSAARPINTDAPKFWVMFNTAKVNSVNIAKGNRVKSVVEEKGINVVKSSACWVWRPKIKVLDHISKNSGSYSCLELKGYLINNGHADLEKMLYD